MPSLASRTHRRIEKFKIALEEGGRVGGGALGASAGVAAKAFVAIYLKYDTGPVGLVVFGVLGAVGGDKLGEFAGEKVAEGVMFGIDAAKNLWNAPETIANGATQLAEILTRLGPAAAKLLGAPGQAILAGVMEAHERVSFENWDLRYLPRRSRRTSARWARSSGASSARCRPMRSWPASTSR